MSLFHFTTISFGFEYSYSFTMSRTNMKKIDSANNYNDTNKIDRIGAIR